MNHIIRRAAKQAGYVPQHSYVPNSIFDGAILAKSPCVYPDSSPELSEEPILYECRECLAHLYEEELDDHDCADYDSSGCDLGD